MIARHAKSPCCSSQIRRFGKRRRQCAKCKKTWSIRPKKRGRPKRRTSRRVIERALLSRYTLRQLAEQRGMLSTPALLYRFRAALTKFLEQPPKPRMPDGPLVLLADGMRFKFAGKPWVLYLTAIKPCSGKTALFFDPMLIIGLEGAWRWERVFSLSLNWTLCRLN